MNACKKDSFSGDPFFCSYHYGTNTSEAVEKVATDEKDYHKCCLCHTYVLRHINDNKKSFFIEHIQHCLKKLQKTFRNLFKKRCNYWALMSFIHSGSETRIYRISSNKKCDGWYIAISQHKTLIKKMFLTSFDKDTETFWKKLDIYNDYPKLKSAFEFQSNRETMFSVILQEQHYKIIL